MASVLFTNVRILDGSGAMPYSGEVLVQGNRISRIGRGARTLPLAGVTTIDAAGATQLRNGFREGSPFKAVNMQFRSSSGQRFELRAHTPASYAADEATHDIYHQMRLLGPEHADYQALDARRRAITDAVPIPTGAAELDELGVPLASLSRYGPAPAPPPAASV